MNHLKVCLLVPKGSQAGFEASIVFTSSKGWVQPPLYKDHTVFFRIA